MMGDWSFLKMRGPIGLLLLGYAEWGGGVRKKKKKIKPLGLFMGGPRQNPKARGPPRLGKIITADHVVKE